MMTLFGDIGQRGMDEAARLAKGIAFILNATLMGLLIAIPSLIFWSYYSKKVETFAVEMESLCEEFIRRQYREENSRNEHSRIAPASSLDVRTPPPRRESRPPAASLHGSVFDRTRGGNHAE